MLTVYSVDNLSLWGILLCVNKPDNLQYKEGYAQARL